MPLSNSISLQSTATVSTPIDWSKPLNDKETRRVTVRKLRNAVFVDLREHYFDKDGAAHPGKKGLCLTQEQFEALMSMGEEIREALSAAK